MTYCEYYKILCLLTFLLFGILLLISYPILSFFLKVKAKTINKGFGILFIDRNNLTERGVQIQSFLRKVMLLLFILIVIEIIIDYFIPGLLLCG